MSVTRLKRKGRRKVSEIKAGQLTMKKLNFKPVIKAVDVDKIKEGFKSGAKKGK